MPKTKKKKFHDNICIKTEYWKLQALKMKPINMRVPTFGLYANFPSAVFPG